MKTFSRLNLFTILCLGFALMLAVSMANAQVDSYAIQGLNQGQALAKDDTREIVLILKDTESNPVPRIQVRFSSGHASFSPSIGTTNNRGEFATKMTVTSLPRPPIESFSVRVQAGADLTFTFPVSVDQGEIEAANIIVNRPDPQNPQTLAAGDTFTQTIGIEKAAVLSAWQMDIVFNPEILEIVDVDDTPGPDITEGDFLTKVGNTFFTFKVDRGKLRVSQTLLDQTLLEKQESRVRPGAGTLLTITFKLKEFAEESLGLHNIQLSKSDGTRVSYSTLIYPVVATRMYIAEDVNRDGMLNILDLVAVAGSMGEDLGKANPINPRADVNKDGIINVLDLIAIVGSPNWNGTVGTISKRQPNIALAPSANASISVNVDTIQSWIDLAHIADDGSTVFDRGIANLKNLVEPKVPSKTRLLMNYPNPFNPETWIPYQLAEATKVTVTIYSMNGTLVRTLDLGHQSAGLYQSKNQAAYWDGQNEFGESVSSGLYFYTLNAGNFSATRKMLILK